ncbi:MAG: N-6 DNA methylase [Candidatus Absconditabacterales bacterium]
MSFDLKTIFPLPDEALAIFDKKSIKALEFFEEKGKTYVKTFEHGGKDKMVSGAKTAPEEIVRQLYTYELIKKFGYPTDRIKLEIDVQFGREVGKKRADIVVYREDMQTPYIIVEVKKPDVKDGMGQLKSYANATGAPILVLTDGKLETILLRTDPNLFESLPQLPKFNETVEDVQTTVLTYKDLEEITNLKQLILDLENAVLANSGVNAFDEIFKLIYAKLYDELETPPNQNRRFRIIAGATNKENLDNICKLFEDAKHQRRDVFKDKDEIEIPENAVIPAVSLLQKYRLFGSNLQVIDDAFEYLISQDSKGAKGQYFTPRIVIDMCVNMLNPQANEAILDPSAGSCGFLLHGMQYVWEHYLNESQFGPRTELKQKEYANEKLYALDFDPRAVKIGKAMMLIAGDGKTNVAYANSLDSSVWEDTVKTKFRNHLLSFKDYDENKRNQDKMIDFDFDIVMTNPPFAGEQTGTILNNYDLGFKRDKDFQKTNKHQNSVDRHILFIERNLNFLRPGGRMAIVLPQGVFNNTSEEYVRKFIMSKARILGVIGLDGNAFKPHTGTKTSVLLLQKRENKKLDNYPIFFATSKVPFKDNSGEYIYVNNEDGKKLRNDLEDIAQAFVAWGKEKDQNFKFLLKND